MPRTSGLDVRFVLRGVGDGFLLILAFIPCIFAWVVLPAFGVLLAIPLLAAFFFDHKEFPAFAVQNLGYILFISFRAGADETSIPWRTGYVIAADHVIGFGHTPTAVLQAAFPQHWIGLIASWTYISFFVAAPLVAIALWLSRRGLRRFVVATVLMYFVSVLIMYAVPTVPPWMATASGAIEPIHRLFYDILYPAAPQIMDAGFSASANDVAAMPSVHMATTMLVTLGMTRLGRTASTVGWIYAAVMFFSIVLLGEHWVIDAIAGVAVALGAWYMAGPLTKRFFPGNAAAAGRLHGLSS